MFYFILLFIFLTGCQQEPEPGQWQLICGRNDEHSQKRPLLYQAHTPLHWIRIDHPENQSITDTTLPICEFTIQENEQKIRLTIHTFPITQDNRRIPPQQQVARWKRQFDELDPLSTQVLPDSHSGFSGLYFEGQGLLQGKSTSVLGWSMQLATMYSYIDQSKRADYTIKAQGPPDLVDKHRLHIWAFARSFELIDELP